MGGLFIVEKLKVAIIGIGHQTIEDHIPSLKDSRYAELIAVCDINEEVLNLWKNKLQVKGYRDFKELLENEKPDFIIIATPHYFHKKIIIEAAKKRIHVLKEKPFAMSLKEAEEIIKLSRKNKIEIMTTLQRRFNPIYITFFQLKDQIGENFFVDAKYTFYVENPHEGWRGNKKYAGGGCIMDMGYHMIDMVIWFYGLPDEVHAEFSNCVGSEASCDIEDTAVILFKYKNRPYGKIMLSRCLPPKTEEITVLGDKGIIKIKRGSIKRFKSNGEIAESLFRDKAWPVAAVNQIDYFCQVIKKEKNNIGSPEYHLQHVAFIEACYKSKERMGYVSPREIINFKSISVKNES